MKQSLPALALACVPAAALAIGQGCAGSHAPAAGGATPQETERAAGDERGREARQQAGGVAGSPSSEASATEPREPSPPLPEEIERLELPDVARLQEGVYITTLSTPPPFDVLMEAGVATVIDLHPVETSEAQAARERGRAIGISYVSIPFHDPGSVMARRVKTFADVIRKEAARGHILIQTEAPAAAATFISARAAYYGDSTDEAIAEGRRFGLPGDWEQAVRQLIEKKLR